MSRAEITTVDEDGARVLADINSSITALNTAAGAIDDTNVREEGLDHKTVDRTGLVDIQWGGLESGLLQHQQSSITEISSGARTGSFTVPANGVARIRCKIGLSSGGSYHGLSSGANQIHNFALRVLPNGGSVTTLSGSQMRKGGGTQRPGTVFLEHWLDTADTYDYATIAAWSSGSGTIQVDSIRIIVEVFKRSST